MLVVERSSGDARITHAVVRDLPEWLATSDLVVVNRTRVIPARLLGRRLPGEGACELLLLEPLPPRPADLDPRPAWRAMVRPARRLRPGQRVRLTAREGAGAERSAARGDKGPAPGASPEVEVESLGDGFASVRLPLGAVPLDFLQHYGETPLPPYIHRPGGPAAEDAERYQTVYAREPGSVAAPTAGLHLTPEIFARMDARGVSRTELVLHVGPATFLAARPGQSAQRVEAERYAVPPEARRAVQGAVAEGRRVVAVGTTTTRALESAARAGWPASEARTDLVIHPGFEFAVVNALLTNFHLPGTSLLGLVAALLGVELAREVYAVAVGERYRFYSFGDAMLIL